MIAESDKQNSKEARLTAVVVGTSGLVIALVPYSQLVAFMSSYGCTIQSVLYLHVNIWPLHL